MAGQWHATGTGRCPEALGTLVGRGPIDVVLASVSTVSTPCGVRPPRQGLGTRRWSSSNQFSVMLICDGVRVSSLWTMTNSWPSDETS